MVTAKQLEKITLLLQKNRAQQAREECQKLLKKAAENTELTYLLALSFIGLSRFKEAEQLLLQLNKQYPQRADVCNALAQVYKIQEPGKALYWQQSAVERKPTTEHLNNLATLLSQNGFINKAILIAKQAVLSSGQSEAAELLLCSLLNKAGRFREALVSTESVPDSADKYLLQAEAWIGLNQPPAAEEMLDKLSVLPLDMAKLRFVVTGYRSIDAFDKAVAALQKHAKNLDQSRLTFLKLKVGNATTAEVEVLVRRFDTLPWPNSDKSQLAYELAKNHKKTDKGIWLQWLHRANQLQKQLDPYNETKLLEHFEQATAALDNISLPTLDTQDIEPVFIVGMPRSGTTLVESILYAHSQCFACGESNALNSALQMVAAIPEVSHQHYFNVIENINSQTEQELTERARRYYKHMRQFSDRKLLIDKMPHNFLYTLLINYIFPKAKIIHVARHPVATILSIYEQSFSSFHSYGNDLSTLIRYYKKYQQFMERCLSLLPEGRVHTIRYEDLVSDPDKQVRLLLDYCQLPFETECLQFEKQQRTIATASVSQVRQGIYKAALNPWKGIEAQLTELLDEFPISGVAE